MMGKVFNLGLYLLRTNDKTIKWALDIIEGVNVIAWLCVFLWLTLLHPFQAWDIAALFILAAFWIPFFFWKMGRSMMLGELYHGED